MENIIFVTDIGKDPDDVLALVALVKLHKTQKLNLLGIITNCGNKKITLKRAKFVAGILKELKVNIPVCAGIGAKVLNNIGTHANFFVNSKTSKIYIKANKEKIATNSNNFIKNTIQKNKCDVSFVVCAGFTDVYNFINNNQEIAMHYIKNFFIMANGIVKDNSIIPDACSYNNSINIVSAKLTYDFANKHNVLLYFMPSYAVKTTPVNMDFYKKLVTKNKLVYNYLFNVQKQAFKKHYVSAIKNKNKLSNKYNLSWFLKNFTDLTDVKKYNFNTVWKHTNKLYLYDPFTILTINEELRAKYFLDKQINNAHFLTPESSALIIELLSSLL